MLQQKTAGNKECRTRGAYGLLNQQGGRCATGANFSAGNPNCTGFSQR
jgi:hypothetical protein